MFPMRPFHRLALSNLSAAIAVSPGVESRLREVFPAEKIRLVPNGLDAAAGDESDTRRHEFRELHSIPSDAFVVGTIGELKPLKGQRDFVLAAGEIVKRFPEAFFVVAGVDNTIDQKFRRELRRLVGVLGMAERFLWLDWIEDTAPFFSGLDIFVSPSHSESFGLATLEAMSRGRPIVATDTDGARLLLGDACGLVPVEDPIALADAVCRLLGDDGRRTALAESLRAIADEHYSLDRMIGSTEELYREIVSHRVTTASVP
jgi:glycosyltransferase involved in cell wall biosynthesis